MMKIKYDAQLIKLMSFFESATHARLRDCLIDGNGVLTFVVADNIGLAIGKNGATAKRLESSLKRKLKIVAFSEDLEQFIRNLIAPLKIRGIERKEDKTVVITPEPESRGYIIGRAASSLRNYESIVKRYFDVKELRVV